MGLTKTQKSQALAVAVAGVGAYVLTRGRRPPARASAGGSLVSDDFLTWPMEYGEAASMIRRLAAPAGSLMGQPGIGDFLAATAYTESRGNPTVIGDGGYTRGWFSLAADTSKLSERGLPLAALRNPHASVALACDLFHRLRNYRAQGQEVTFLAIRRGWAAPRLVGDEFEEHSRSAAVRERFAIALGQAGVPVSFMDRPAFPPAYRYPGFAAIWNAVVRPRT